MKRLRVAAQLGWELRKLGKDMTEQQVNGVKKIINGVFLIADGATDISETPKDDGYVDQLKTLVDLVVPVVLKAGK